MLRKHLHEENRAAWNLATDAHNSHKIDQAKFLRHGGSTLYPEELEFLGDLNGKSLVHLQCNAGQDTLSLVQHGATVTGVDISDNAVAFAQKLSTDSGIPATFIRSDVFDWLESTPERFDVAFSSYGALIWLSDIQTWAKGVARILKPAGRFALVEFHPMAMVFEYDWSLQYPYFAQGDVVSFENGVGDYVAMSGEALAPSGYVEGVKDFVNPKRSHEFLWGVGEIITALLDAGLSLTAFKEYPYMNGGKLFGDMREAPGGRMYPPDHIPRLPMMYGLSVDKKA
jgi:SAM-dependent methyltransferase